MDKTAISDDNKSTVQLNLEEKVRELEEKNKFQAEYIAGLKQSRELLQREIARLKACLIRNL